MPRKRLAWTAALAAAACAWGFSLPEREKNQRRKMVKNVRVTYRRRHSYATKSNGIVAVKTPGTPAHDL